MSARNRQRRENNKRSRQMARVKTCFACGKMGGSLRAIKAVVYLHDQKVNPCQTRVEIPKPSETLSSPEVSSQTT